MVVGSNPIAVTILILRNKGFHKFVLTILPRPLFITLMDFLYYVVDSKLFISKDSLMLSSSMLGNFASVFGCSQFNRPSQSLKCLVAPDASNYLVMLSSWCSIDRVSMRFFCFSNVSPYSHNLICKHRGNRMGIAYFVVAQYTL